MPGLDPNSFSAEPFFRSVMIELNRLIRGPSLYTRERFLHVSITEETRDMARAYPEGEELAKLNRRLLEEAYPSEFHKILSVAIFEVVPTPDFY